MNFNSPSLSLFLWYHCKELEIERMGIGEVYRECKYMEKEYLWSQNIFFYIPQRASTFPLGKQMVPAQQNYRRKWVIMESERWQLTLLQNLGSAFTLEMVALVLLSQC